MRFSFLFFFSESVSFFLSFFLYYVCHKTSTQSHTHDDKINKKSIKTHSHSPFILHSTQPLTYTLTENGRLLGVHSGYGMALSTEWMRGEENIVVRSDLVPTGVKILTPEVEILISFFLSFFLFSFSPFLFCSCCFSFYFIFLFMIIVLFLCEFSSPFFSLLFRLSFLLLYPSFSFPFFTSFHLFSHIHSQPHRHTGNQCTF